MSSSARPDAIYGSNELKALSRRGPVERVNFQKQDDETWWVSLVKEGSDVTGALQD